MRNSVLLIDDESEAMKYYVVALERKGFDVVQLRDADAVLDFIERATNRRPDVIILDVMLPPGRRFHAHPDVEEGLRTGILLYPELRKSCGDVPIIVLTNVGNPDLLHALPSDARVLQKVEVPPFELVDIVTEVMHKEIR